MRSGKSRGVYGNRPFSGGCGRKNTGKALRHQRGGYGGFRREKNQLVICGMELERADLADRICSMGFEVMEG